MILISVPPFPFCLSIFSGHIYLNLSIFFSSEHGSLLLIFKKRKGRKTAFGSLSFYLGFTS